MHKQLPLWEFLLQQLLDEQPVMLLYVIESKGSSPGRQGFMMVVKCSGANAWLSWRGNHGTQILQSSQSKSY
jgi:xanthine dehydrogenase accessory factor